MNDDDYTADWRADLIARGHATLTGRVYYNGQPVIDDDEGGTAGVREPLRPRPRPPGTSMHLAQPADRQPVGALALV